MARRKNCAYCQIDLQFLGGREISGAEYGGNSRSDDDFRCPACGRRYRRIQHEYFDRLEERWYESADDDWLPLPEEDPVDPPQVADS